MRYLIISDIHSNLPALETVVADAEGRGFDQILCLGDVVGYGPHPNECSEWVRENAQVCIAGNHDWACIGKVDLADFNPVAAQASRWTRKTLTSENLTYLQERPLLLTEEEYTLVHGSLVDPIWEYVTNNLIAQASFNVLTTKLLFHGHTHVPVLFQEKKDAFPAVILPQGDQTFSITEVRLIINPGSVGQPRDGDPRASYLIYDSGKPALEFFRVDYPITRTQEAIRAQGLPESLALRLAYGR